MLPGEIFTYVVFIFPIDAASFTSHVRCRSWAETMVTFSIATNVVNSLAIFILPTSIFCWLYSWIISISIIDAVFFIQLSIRTEHWKYQLNRTMLMIKGPRPILAIWCKMDIVFILLVLWATHAFLITSHAHTLPLAVFGKQLKGG